MTAPLPRWVWDLVIAIQESEDQHPAYYGDFHNGLRRLESCPESQFLALVPDLVRLAAAERADDRKSAAATR